MIDHKTITANTIPEAYRKAVYYIWNFGKVRLDERGDLMKEVRDLKIVIPTDDISHCEGKLNKTLDDDFAEGLINPELAAKKGTDFDYAYGANLRKLNQLEKTIERLCKHPETRRAVIPLFDKIDNCMTINEVPCWIIIQFIIREEQLHAEVMFRSNNVFGAFPADCYGIRKLQEYVVMRVNEYRVKTGEPLVSMGDYSHTITSAHALINDAEAIKAFLKV